MDAIEVATGLKPRRHYVEGRPFDVPRSILAIDRAGRELGWSPCVGLRDGISRTGHWLRETNEF
jgi:UDP-glucose 4-epimerase